MAKLHKLLLALGLIVLVSAPSFASAIVPGFNTTSDGRNDDGTYTAPTGCNNAAPGGTCAGTAVPLGMAINFFGVNFSSIYINTNGNVTLDAPLSTFTPFGLTAASRQIIAPFFADVDTRNVASGVVTFGSGLFGGRNAFGVNWINVGYYSEHVDKTNSFQLLIVTVATRASGISTLFSITTIWIGKPAMPAAELVVLEAIRLASDFPTVPALRAHRSSFPARPLTVH